MTFANFGAARLARARRAAVICGAALIGLAACGGGNPLDNPPSIGNPPGTGGQKLSFAYFQKCINPVFLKDIQPNVKCAGSGCHESVSGPGGAFRVVVGATVVDLTNPANTPAVIRTSDIYKNFYSAQGSVVIGSITASRLLTKPLVQGTLHGGGLVFTNPADPDVALLQYWITHPSPQGQDEFSFTPANTATCSTL